MRHSSTNSYFHNTQGSRKSLLDDFTSIHEDLGFNKPGSSAAKQLLQQTIADPQQRIGKMLKLEYSTDRYRVKMPSYDDDGNALGNNNTKNSSITASDLKDLEDLKNTYRKLQADYIELQIDLDAVKTDRDTLMIELKGARDKLSKHDSENSKTKIASIQMGRSLKMAETELNEVRNALLRKEDSLDRLLNDLADEKQARINADNGYQTRIKEFLSRFEAMKR
jgi:FtsZ-binding cell division protein ZapB